MLIITIMVAEVDDDIAHMLDMVPAWFDHFRNIRALRLPSLDNLNSFEYKVTLSDNSNYEQYRVLTDFMSFLDFYLRYAYGPKYEVIQNSDDRRHNQVQVRKLRRPCT